MKTSFLCLTLFLSIMLLNCTTLQETSGTEENKEPELYVFDDVENIDSIEIKNAEKAFDDSVKTILDSMMINKKDTVKTIIKELQPEIQDRIQQKIGGYAVQLGAFSSLERAEEFVKENQSRTIYYLNIFQKPSANLFVVQTSPVNTREEADLIRNALRKNSTFKDAFIVSD